MACPDKPIEVSSVSIGKVVRVTNISSVSLFGGAPDTQIETSDGYVITLVGSHPVKVGDVAQVVTLNLGNQSWTGSDKCIRIENNEGCLIYYR